MLSTALVFDCKNNYKQNIHILLQYINKTFTFDYNTLMNKFCQGGVLPQEP